MITSNDTTIQSITSTASAEEKKIWSILEGVLDPEVPVLSIVDLGIVRKVQVDSEEGSNDRAVTITITPTYSGCPAMDVIGVHIRMALLQQGYMNLKLVTVLSPAWSTDWMTEAGKQKLKAYGVAPPNPHQSVCHPDAFAADEAIECPRCNSYNTRLISQFGSTACKALYQCNDCKEPFDYFKCH